ncbi:hemin uptake protein HemP [Yersinia kristensenii]|uniref:hemin uptake protein HemP n=1 Tax=Yersinia kristensenii TaxID=28152 RepID=UPI00067E5482|nr:hemin uptake protein HemP [Yersinia kristensenii]MDA5474237.1 hemin uptake protein HemP [Yersinia kristensenii]MDA5478962.1 hemin uptake protein HemP [Yersinia kristensenii]MDA5505409.1 hemin uptake protein HemP [Yersinia kristensenii]MDA5522477.1 hemin uptake protein HemP [Yersinia kristensenii]NIK94296.1 hemin uptake protein HemP [Yersinia kristensenii]
MQKTTYHTPNASDQTLPSVPLSCINSQQLLGLHDVVAINHQGQLYYLRQTKAGKLILTK